MESCDFTEMDDDMVHIKEIIDIQRLLLNISDENYLNTKISLITFSIFQSEDGVQEFLHRIIITMSIKPGLDGLIARLLADIVTNYFNQFPFLSLVNEFMFKAIFHPRNKFSYLDSIDPIVFICSCSKFGLVSELEIVNQVKGFYEQYPTFPHQIVLFTILFSPILELHNKEFYSLLLVFSNEYSKDPMFPIELCHGLNELNRLKDNNWKLFNDSISCGAIVDSMEYSIKFDDTELFLKYSSVSNFDYNQSILASVFERNSFLQRTPTLLSYAAFFGSIKCFKILVLSGADPKICDTLGKSTIHFAAASRDISFYRFVSQWIDSFDGGPHFSARFYNFDLFEWFYNNNPIILSEIHPTFGSVMHQACLSENFEIVLLCIKHGITPNYVSEDGWTPLHVAAQNGNYSLMKLFLKNSVDINVQDTDGVTS